MNIGTNLGPIVGYKLKAPLLAKDARNGAPGRAPNPVVKMKDFAHRRLARAVNECIGPSARKERGLQDDTSGGRRRVRLLHGETQSSGAEVAGDYSSYRGMHIMQSRIQGSSGSVETCGRSCGTPQTSIRAAPMRTRRSRRRETGNLSYWTQGVNCGSLRG